MTNLELVPTDSMNSQAWKACALFHLYFQLSGEGQVIQRDELIELLEPYIESIEVAMYEGCEDLRQECGRITHLIRYQDSKTIMDGVGR